MTAVKCRQNLQPRSFSVPIRFLAVPAWSFGALELWSVALLVVIMAIAAKFYSQEVISATVVLVGPVAGYVLALILGMVNFALVEKVRLVVFPDIFPQGGEFSLGAIIAVTLICIVSAVETVGDTSVTAKAGANRDATDKEITGATYADGLGTAVVSVFGGLPNISFSQNVGIVGMTAAGSAVHGAARMQRTAEACEAGEFDPNEAHRYRLLTCLRAGTRSASSVPSGPRRYARPARP